MFRIMITFFILSTICWSDLITPSQLGWMDNLTEAKERALKEKKPIVIFLHSRRCFYCPKMIEEVFPDPKVKKYLKDNFVRLSLDVATGSDSIEDDASDQAPDRFIVSMTPAFIYMGPKEEKLYRKGKKHMIVYGYWNSDDFIKWGQEAIRRFDRLYGEKYGRKK